MNELALKAIVKVVQQRNAEGDCPTVERPGAELLENAILELADLSGLGIARDVGPGCLLFRGYRVTCVLAATFKTEACDFSDLVDIWRKESCPALGNMVRRIDGFSEDSTPLFFVGEIKYRKSMRDGTARPTFEIQLVIPEPHTAESLMRQLSDELEPLGWGICDFDQGAIAKQDQAEIQQHLENVAQARAGKPLY